jgi:Resolvase, N terminal domain
MGIPQRVPQGQGVAKVVSFAREFPTATSFRKSILQKQDLLRGVLRSLTIKMKIGYARVSTLEQNLDLQLQALEKCGCRKIFREKVSSASRERPQLQRMLDQLRAGDTIVVWKLDRLARSTRDLLETMEVIREAGGKFRSLSEPWADTTTHAGKMIMTIFAGIAEFERDLITRANRDGARSRSKKRSPIRASSKTEFRSGTVGSTACSRRQIGFRYRANL